MLPLPELQQSFGRFITGKKPQPIAQYFKSEILPVTDILQLHRNNFRVTLSEALASIFPAINNLLGEDCFNAYAVSFVEENPPKSPVLSAYGSAFPRFLEKQEALFAFPYLGDVARLELAWNQAFHSADAEALSPLTMQNAAPDDINLKLHPAVHLVQSAQSVFPIWQVARNPEDQSEKIELRDCAEYLLITRPQYEISVSPIDAGTHAMLSAIGNACALTEAVDIALAVSPDFSLEGSLANLLVRGAFATTTPSSKEQTNEYTS